MKTLLGLILVLAICGKATALECDDFTLPNDPMADVGELISERISKDLMAVLKTQDQKPLTTVEIAKGLHSRIGKVIAKAFYLKTQLGYFMAKDLPKNVQFSPGHYQSIYRGVKGPLPLVIRFARSPSYNIHGLRFGGDKVGHMVNEGYQYYKIVNEEIDKRGRSPIIQMTLTTEAGRAGVLKAIAMGVRKEKRFYGKLISGVYSNGDLAANFIGMKFYFNLTEDIRVGHEALPPILVKAGNRWVFRTGFDPKALLKPFVSEHLNEAYNPSNYYLGAQGAVEKNVRARCQAWQAFLGEDFNVYHFAAKQAAYADWYGEEYGYHFDAEHAVSMLQECEEHLYGREEKIISRDLR
jgi:hypothetical protein